MTKTESYKGFTISKGSLGWKAVDADGELFEVSSKKHCLKGFISAFVNGDQWAIEELRRAGYSKV